ncbi:hypothetical protein [Fulvimarina sp. MAC3]|uniref:hypothetical protein n=1 Tax=Fulvimarina sp. MAC3 TaxID=3148887 RepID=UPI0031FD0291
MNNFIDGFISTFFTAPPRALAQKPQAEPNPVAASKPGEPPKVSLVDVVGEAARAQAIAKFTAWQLEASQVDPSLAKPDAAATQIGKSSQNAETGRIAIMTRDAVRAAYAEN